MKIAKTFRSALAVAIVLALCLCMLPATVSAACPLVAGTGYRMATVVSATKTLWFTGTIDSSGNLVASTAEADAALVYIEASGSGYKLYTNSGSKKYIKSGNSTTKNSFVSDAASATVFTWNDSMKTFEYFDGGSSTRAFAADDNNNRFRAYANTGSYHFASFVPVGTQPTAPGAVTYTPGTIAQALAAAANTKWEVTGVVTFTDGRNIYLQDNTGAICAYFSTAQSDVAVGDQLTVTGNRTTYSGLPELGGAALVNKTAGTAVTPKEVTIDTLTDADICKSILIKNVIITDVDDNDGAYANPTITVEDEDGNSIQIYKAVMSKTGDNWDVKVGDKVNVTAVLSIYNDYQLRNNAASDIVIVPASNPDNTTATTAPATTAGTTAGTTAATTAGTTPETGDNTGVMGMVAVMILAVTGMVALVVGNKKRFF